MTLNNRDIVDLMLLVLPTALVCWFLVKSERDDEVRRRKRNAEYADEVRRRKRNAELQASVAGDDIISQLPDDILALIITQLPLKESYMTSVLSKRWKTLFKFVENISISCADIPPKFLRERRARTLLYQRPYCVVESGHDPFMSYSWYVLDGLTKYLKRVCEGHYKMRSLELRCCMSGDEAKDSDFKRSFFDYLQHTGVESLDLWFCCHQKDKYKFHDLLCFPLDHLYLLGFLKFLRMSFCDLHPAKNSYSPIQTLELSCVKVFPNSLESILSTCLRLHSLSILECVCPTKLSIAAATNLKSLTIRYCMDVEEIQVCATNLMLLEFVGYKEVDLVFDSFPHHLQTLHFCVQAKNKSMPRGFREYAKNLPNLRYLTVATTPHFFQESSSFMRVGVGMFVELRQLELHVCCMSKLNLLSLIPILQNCPLLEEFHLDLQNVDYEEEPQLKVNSIYKSMLKKVEIRGFNGKENEIDFALSILSSAVMLQEMRISWFSKCYSKCCRWKTLLHKEIWSEETIHQKLQGQAISSNARLIIEAPSFRIRI